MTLLFRGEWKEGFLWRRGTYSLEEVSLTKGRKGFNHIGSGGFNAHPHLSDPRWGELSDINQRFHIHYRQERK